MVKEVLIEVVGGVAYCIVKPTGVRVVIVDHDNEKSCDDYTPEVYESNDEIKGD